mmetsp:Transcript_10108/g.36968  ORF Transcript_10108/g.36968 Transcript_10108/m.36968 type:complete len:207 (-) Transcript_10108:266-886(-)
MCAHRNFTTSVLGISFAPVSDARESDRIIITERPPVPGLLVRFCFFFFFSFFSLFSFLVSWSFSFMRAFSSSSSTSSTSSRPFHSSSGFTVSSFLCRCLLKTLFIVNMESVLRPLNTAFNLPSSMISLLSDGFCSSFCLTYSQIFFTTSVLGSSVNPKKSDRAGDKSWMAERPVLRLGLAGGKGRFPLSSTSASPLVFPSTLGLFG